VIVMPDRIRTSRALLDIGAAGPLAGMAVAIPTMVIGLHQSPIIQRSATGFVQEGQSLLYIALKWLVVGPLRPDQDVLLHPTAYAAWFGFLITFLNLIPIGQLDGGHVVYALLGRHRHALVARWMMRLPLAMVVYNLWVHGLPVLTDALHRGGPEPNWGRLITAVMPWVTIAVLLVVLRRFTGQEHPPVDDPVLTKGRRRVAIGTLVLFVLLFMPSPLVVY
jgi:membrane-associated protease RseP (regulator of RpoE activity)